MRRIITDMHSCANFTLTINTHVDHAAEGLRHGRLIGLRLSLVIGLRLL